MWKSFPPAIHKVLSIKGQFDGLLGITFTGTSAKQTAVLGLPDGPVAS